MGLSKQEMFNRAVKGLASQGFERAFNANTGCMYYDKFTNRRCAWGWVDPEHTPNQSGSVQILRWRGIGEAARLASADVEFANLLQEAHDEGMQGESPHKMKQRLLDLGTSYNLEIPAVLRQCEAAQDDGPEACGGEDETPTP